MLKTRIKILILLAASLLAFCRTSTAATKLRLVSFNVLNSQKADSLCPWNYRLTPLCMNLHKLGAGVLCLQDVSSSQLTDIQQGLPEYSVVPHVGPVDTTISHNPILYDAKELKMLSRGNFWLSETPEEKSSSWNMPKPREAMWAVFQNISTGKSFIVCNVCSGEMEEQAKLYSAILLKTYLGKMSNGVNVILAGSLDTSDKEISYNALLTRILSMKDAWTCAGKQLGSPETFNRLGKGNATRSDFIITTDEVDCTKAAVESVEQMDGRFLSDHNILWADLKWK